MTHAANPMAATSLQMPKRSGPSGKSGKSGKSGRRKPKVLPKFNFKPVPKFRSIQQPKKSRSGPSGKSGKSGKRKPKMLDAPVA